MKTFEGKLVSKGAKIGIVALFNTIVGLNINAKPLNLPKEYSENISVEGHENEVFDYDFNNDGINEKVVYPHSFRHRYAKNFLEKFNDISLLADLMGHESIETTRIYLRRTASEQRELVDSIVTW